MEFLVGKNNEEHSPNKVRLRIEHNDKKEFAKPLVSVCTKFVP
jgi:hypothetical protein